MLSRKHQSTIRPGRSLLSCGSPGCRTRRQGQTNVKQTEARSWLDQFPKITNEVSAVLIQRGLSGAEWEVLWDVWQHTSGHFDRRKRATRTEYKTTAQQIAERCSHSADHVRKAISRLVKQNILHRPVVGRHGGHSVLAFNWDVSTWTPRAQRPRGSAEAHSRSRTTACETGQERPATAGQQRPPKHAIAGQERPPLFNGNERAEHKAPLPIDDGKFADRETAAPAAFDGRVAGGEPGPQVDGDGPAPRYRPPEDLDFLDLIRAAAIAMASRDDVLAGRPPEGSGA